MKKVEGSRSRALVREPPEAETLLAFGGSMKAENFPVFNS